MPWISFSERGCTNRHPTCQLLGESCLTHITQATTECCRIGPSSSKIFSKTPRSKRRFSSRQTPVSEMSTTLVMQGSGGGFCSLLQVVDLCNGKRFWARPSCFSALPWTSGLVVVGQLAPE